MNKYGYDGEERFRPMSPWGYFGYSLLFSIPLIGLILLIVFSLNNENINRRNYARSFFIGVLIAAVILLILTLTGAFASLSILSSPSYSRYL